MGEVGTGITDSKNNRLRTGGRLGGPKDRLCLHYACFKECKYGSACKWSHKLTSKHYEKAAVIVTIKDFQRADRLVTWQKWAAGEAKDLTSFSLPSLSEFTAANNLKIKDLKQFDKPLKGSNETSPLSKTKCSGESSSPQSNVLPSRVDLQPRGSGRPGPNSSATELQAKIVCLEALHADVTDKLSNATSSITVLRGEVAALTQRNTTLKNDLVYEGDLSRGLCSQVEHLGYSVETLKSEKAELKRVLADTEPVCESNKRMKGMLISQKGEWLQEKARLQGR